MDPTTELTSQEPLAAAAIGAIHKGNVDELKSLLSKNPGLATARIIEVRKGRKHSRSLLHIATDWPGHFPNGAETATALVSHGADINARFEGSHAETPLHWAASSDDVAVPDALLDGGADIEAAGAVIGGGAPLADAVAFGQWNAARRLVERGARTSLWQASALGLLDRIEAHFAEGVPLRDEITNAFWSACHGGQRETAEYLLHRGADLNWIGHGGLTPLDVAARSGAGNLTEWLRLCGARSAKESVQA